MKIAMPAFLKVPFAWRHVGDKGAWRYEENAVTGQRRAHNMGPHGPIDGHWLEGKRPDLFSGAPRPATPGRDSTT